MVSPTDVYHIVEATLPLYTAMILAYASVKWWKVFTVDQCAGINKFVARFSIPLLSFQVVATNNFYKMNLKLICADFLQKFLVFSFMTLITKISSRGSLDWVVTGLSLSTLPNTLILGIPLLRAMYGVGAAGVLSQIIVLQSLIWYNLLLLLFEINATREVHVTKSSSIVGEIEPLAEGEEGEAPKEESQDEAKSRSQKFAIIMLTVGRKLISNPNTHATLAGLIWASVHFRLGVQLPRIVNGSISILSDGGLGMAMFSLGLFMASQARILGCGARKASFAISMRFLVGPVVMAGCSVAVGLRGTLLKVAIVQAALPQGIVPFVFAKEYNVHPDILSTGIFLGLLIATPVALAYYYMLSL